LVTIRVARPKESRGLTCRQRGAQDVMSEPPTGQLERQRRKGQTLSSWGCASLDLYHLRASLARRDAACFRFCLVGRQTGSWASEAGLWTKDAFAETSIRPGQAVENLNAAVAPPRSGLGGRVCFRPVPEWRGRTKPLAISRANTPGKRGHTSLRPILEREAEPPPSGPAAYLGARENVPSSARLK
jgi:hypothetical protein